MSVDGVNVLLIGQNARKFSSIIQRLAKSGCHCLLTHSLLEALNLVATGSFELILSANPQPDNAMRSLEEALAGTRASLFCAYPVEITCWWLPVLTNGTLCLGEAALRPPEFASLLDRVVDDIRAFHSSAAAKANTPSSSRPAV